MNGPLSLWNNTPVGRVIAVISRSATPGSPDFVPPAKQIAGLFDNDGALVGAKNRLISSFFLLCSVSMRWLRPIPPCWNSPATKRLSKTIWLTSTACILAISQIEEIALRYPSRHNSGGVRSSGGHVSIARITPAFFGIPFDQLTYQPMIELIRYLEALISKSLSLRQGG